VLSALAVFVAAASLVMAFEQGRYVSENRSPVLYMVWVVLTAAMAYM
jgi:hypothetical protein